MAKKEFSLHSKMSISATYFLSQIYVTKINIQHRNLDICKNFFLQKWNTKSQFQTRVNLKNKNCLASLCQLSQNKYHKIFSRFSECWVPTDFLALRTRLSPSNFNEFFLQQTVILILSWCGFIALICNASLKQTFQSVSANFFRSLCWLDKQDQLIGAVHVPIDANKCCQSSCRWLINTHSSSRDDYTTGCL